MTTIQGIQGMIASITFLLSWKQLPNQHIRILSPHKKHAKGKAAKAIYINERSLGSKVSRADRFTDVVTYENCMSSNVLVTVNYSSFFQILPSGHFGRHRVIFEIWRKQLIIKLQNDPTTTHSRPMLPINRYVFISDK